MGCIYEYINIDYWKYIWLSYDNCGSGDDYINYICTYLIRGQHLL